MVEWVQTLPLWWANAITVVLFVGIGSAVFLFPKRRIFEDAPDQSGWRDIRWWALGLITVQLGIYVLFG
ncbi:MAG: hypothetical protein R3E82_14120 [Pseudomonadales bacterium]|nr:hypothetical protein [Pseudomonadales bacterium]